MQATERQYPPFLGAYDPTEKRISAQEYLHTHQAGALVPLAQAAITGLLVGLIVLTVLIWQKISDAYVYSLLTFLISTLATWLYLQRHWFRLTDLERVTGLDINRDGRIGDELPRRHKIKVDIQQVHDGGFTSTKTAEFPVDENDLAKFALGVMAGQPMTEKAWTGAGKPFSVNQFRALRVEMLGRGVIELVNQAEPRQGYKLTKAGRSVMQYFAALSPTPPGEGE